MRMGEPTKPNCARSWLIRKRSYEKWNVVATFVKKTNDGGATPTIVNDARSSVSVRPITLASPPNRRCQKA